MYWCRRHSYAILPSYISVKACIVTVRLSKHSRSVQHPTCKSFFYSRTGVKTLCKCSFCRAHLVQKRIWSNAVPIISTEKLKCLQEVLFRCLFVHQKSHMCCPVFETVISRSAKRTASGQTYDAPMNLQVAARVYRVSMRRTFTVFSYFLSPCTDVNLKSWLCHYLCGKSPCGLSNASEKKVVSRLVLLSVGSLSLSVAASCRLIYLINVSHWLGGAAHGSGK